MKKILILILVNLFSIFCIFSVSASEVETVTVPSEVVSPEDGGSLTYYQGEVVQRLANIEEIQLQTIQFLIFLFVVLILYVIFRSFTLF